MHILGGLIMPARLDFSSLNLMDALDLAILIEAEARERYNYFTEQIYVARGEHSTAHYAICTGFMALGMMIPGMWSGWLQELIGYQHFFVWVILATIPSFLVVLLIPLDREFGKKS